MKRSAIFGLMLLLSCHAGLACESLVAGADPWELAVRAPIAGDWRRTIVHQHRTVRRADRMSNVLRRGIEYTAPSGTPVAAVNGGRVTSVLAYAGYGNAIIIDHGAGVKSLYGRVDSFDVSEGDCVAAGAVIARVGSIGEDTNSTFFFEVSDDSQFIWPISPRSRVGPESK